LAADRERERREEQKVNRFLKKVQLACPCADSYGIKTHSLQVKLKLFGFFRLQDFQGIATTDSEACSLSFFYFKYLHLSFLSGVLLGATQNHDTCAKFNILATSVSVRRLIGRRQAPGEWNT
jgi:hypothetical protein